MMNCKCTRIFFDKFMNLLHRPPSLIFHFTLYWIKCWRKNHERLSTARPPPSLCYISSLIILASSFHWPLCYGEACQLPHSTVHGPQTPLDCPRQLFLNCIRNNIHSVTLTQSLVLNSLLVDSLHARTLYLFLILCLSNSLLVYSLTHSNINPISCSSLFNCS